jgi:hypothetical protein
MDWRDIAAIVFACTAVNHLGLMGKIEEVTGKTIPILNCPKCASFWATLMYLLLGTKGNLWEFPLWLAISLLCAYLAIWLELLMYAIDTLYNIIYGILENNNKEDRDERGAEG